MQRSIDINAKQHRYPYECQGGLLRLWKFEPDVIKRHDGEGGRGVEGANLCTLAMYFRLHFRLHLGYSLGYTSATLRLHLGYTWGTLRLHFAYTSATL